MRKNSIQAGRILGALFLLARVCSAQQSEAFQPSYLFLSGIEYDYYGKTGFSLNSVFGARLGKTSNLYSYTTLETTATLATLRTGVGYTFITSGPWRAVALGDAGVTSTSGNTLGSFSGGGLLFYDLRSTELSGPHFYIAGGVRLLNITSQAAQPIAILMVGAGF